MSRIAIIERCGQCEHSKEHRVCYEGWQPFCEHPSFGLKAPRVESMKSAPPDWCPLPPAADVARVKPLAWRDWPDGLGHMQSMASTALLWCTVRYLIRAPDGGPGGFYWRIDVASGGRAGDWKPCDSIADGKLKAIEAYRAALFGDNGPLVQIMAATTPEAAPNETQAHNQGEKPHCGGCE